MPFVWINGEAVEQTYEEAQLPTPEEHDTALTIIRENQVAERLEELRKIEEDLGRQFNETAVRSRLRVRFGLDTAGQ